MDEAYQVAASIAALLKRTQGQLAPGLAFDFGAVAGSLSQGGDLWAGHYGTEPLRQHQPHAQLVRERTPQGERLAAGGMLLPIGTGGNGSAILNWLAADEDAGAEMAQLLAQFEQVAREAGCTRIETGRNSFGAGWLGLPSLPVLDAGMQAAGWQQTAYWQVFALRADPSMAIRRPEGTEFDRRVQSPLHIDYVATPIGQETALSECRVWSIPEAFAPLAPDACTIEYVETQPAYRRRGIARALLQAAMIDQGQAGFTHWLLWAKHNAVPMTGLARSLGFAPAFETREWAKSF